MAVRTSSVRPETGPRSLGGLTWLGVAFVLLVAVLASVAGVRVFLGVREAPNDPLAGLAMWGIIALAVVGGVPAILTLLGLAVSWWSPKATTVLVTISATWIVGCGVLWTRVFDIPL